MSFKIFISRFLRQGLEKFHHFRQNKFSFDITLGLLACLGIIGGFILVYDGRRPPRTAHPITQPAASYYKHFIAGSGIVESMSENIEVGTLVSGIIDKVHVEVGNKVKAGSPLFSLDNRQAWADITTQKAAVGKATASLNQAEAALKDAQDKYQLAKNVTDRRALSRDEFLSRENAYSIAMSAHAAAKADLAVAKATLARSQTNLDILTVKAPIDCEVLQINIHPSEFALAGPLVTPLMLIGNVDDKFVRMSIDENDAWRFSPGASAIAYLRGNSAFRIDLEFDHLEPYVLPKRQLTGDSSERVDIRVLQPIYKFKENPPISVYIGQQVDVFIEVPESLSYENMGGKQRANS
ncbi:MAG: secretion protein HlyD [Alphaproteobacteria bacterium]|jgi:HlyD family secretion protein|nr:secretion protein HlyD [Alphaproteobacteria bacterium]